MIRLGVRALVAGRMEPGVMAARLDDLGFLKALVKQACETTGATILDLRAHQFKPYGVTVMALLAESHAALHTWPEHRSWTFEIFTCGACLPGAACGAIRTALPGCSGESVSPVDVPR